MTEKKEKTCKRGHPYSESLIGKDGKRYGCRMCKNTAWASTKKSGFQTFQAVIRPKMSEEEKFFNEVRAYGVKHGARQEQ